MATFPKLPEPLLLVLPFGLAELPLDPLDLPASALDERFTLPLPDSLCLAELFSFLAIFSPNTNKKRNL